MPASLLIGFRHQLSVGRACGLHTHRDWEIVFHPTGSGITTFAEAEIAFGPGDVVVNPPQVAHDQIMATAGDDWCLLVRDFAPPALIADRCWTAQVGHDPTTMAELDWLTSGIATTEPVIADLRVQAVLHTIVARCRIGEQTAMSGPAASLARHALRLAAERGHEIPGVENFAQLLGASTHWLRHACAQTGIPSPQALLTRARLAHAQALLLHTSHPLTEVARQSGYSDARYLIAVFRRELGCTPGQLRAGMGGR